jgi:DNA-binding HxlR family transcriptional regulator
MVISGSDPAVAVEPAPPVSSPPERTGTRQARRARAAGGAPPPEPVDWRDIDLENGSLRRAAEIVGDKWVMLIVRDAMLGITRFDELQHRLGLSAPVLSTRLRRLVEEGILQPQPYREPGQRTRTEYALTRKGAELFHALVAIMQWGDRYLADPVGPALSFRHDRCGGPVRVVVRCDAEDMDVDVDDAHIAPGPGAKPAPNGRYRAAVARLPRTEPG